MLGRLRRSRAEEASEPPHTHGTRVHTKTGDGTVIGSTSDQVLVQPDGGSAVDAQWVPTNKTEVISDNG